MVMVVVPQKDSLRSIELETDRGFDTVENDVLIFLELSSDLGLLHLLTTFYLIEESNGK